MEFRIAWCITGAGHFLLESFEVFLKLVKKKDVKVTTFLSCAGEEVARVYGILDRLEKISPGNYYQEIILEREQDKGFPKTGRFARNRYSALVISPATANTVAKMACGIADTLITSAFAQAQKGEVPTYVVPTDLRAGIVMTKLPALVDHDICIDCDTCLPLEKCPNNAIKIIEKPVIDLTLCRGCKTCVELCPHSAIIFGKEIKTKVRKLDEENVNKVSQLEGVKILKHPSEIYDAIFYIGGN
ncbi:MAG: dihydromethanopterin reductase (acceptor) [Candidatus Jordarchaeum sp.]|uniref:dihydromethanopterin reductase (acceptor) n=1 Tax=Candidatus Jordarchaeum sp. TaxID=2823881 RepID=UPI00404952C0